MCVKDDRLFYVFTNWWKKEICVYHDLSSKMFCVNSLLFPCTHAVGLYAHTLHLYVLNILTGSKKKMMHIYGQICHVHVFAS